jgi:hypothetical protein
MPRPKYNFWLLHQLGYDVSNGSNYRVRTLVLAFALVIPITMIRLRPLMAANDSALSKEQIKEFLLNAQVVGSKEITKGVTHPVVLTLSDGTLTHDASFQSIDEHKQQVRLASGKSEANFVDSYKYNLAAYILAELIGFDDMMPVYVERKWNGTTGSLSWWLPVMMDDQERYLRSIQPPNQDEWNRQIYKLRVFNLLVADTDPNLTNILIDNNWKIWRIDFTRAFRLEKEPQIPNDLQRCDGRLFQRLKALDENEMAARTKKYLTDSEVEAVMARREKIVAHFQKLIAEKGEETVLY